MQNLDVRHDLSAQAHQAHFFMSPRGAMEYTSGIESNEPLNPINLEQI